MSSISEALNPEQHAAVTHSGGPCLVLAGAGSGKTRVITHRIAWLIEQGAVPASICALTFTNKSAAEMRQRVFELLGEEPADLWLLTFHALGLRILRDAAGGPGAPPPGFAIYDRSESLAVWRGCQNELEIDPKTVPPRRLLERCSRGVNALEDPAGWDVAGYEFEQRLAGRIWPAYRAELRRRRAVDFDELLFGPLHALQENPALGKLLRGRFLHLLVDEYQDTNRLQYRLLRELMGSAPAPAASHGEGPDQDDEPQLSLLSAMPSPGCPAEHSAAGGDSSPSASTSPASGSLMVVGDEDQSIYRWRGAQIANVLDFQSDFPGATVIRLERNYRSTSAILAAANSLVGHNRERLGKALHTDVEGPLPQVLQCASGRSESIWVAKGIASRMAAGVTANDLGVLYRTNAQSRPLEEELAGRGVPFRVVGGPTFYRRAEIRDLLAWLKLLVTPDEGAFARAAGQMPGVGPATIGALARWRPGVGAFEALDEILRAADGPGSDEPGANAKAALRAIGCPASAVPGLVRFHEIVVTLGGGLGQTTLSQLVEQVADASGLRESLRSADNPLERLAHLDEVVSSAAELGGTTMADPKLLGRFLDRAALISDAESQSGARRGVSLMTIHAAKGLEFDTVWVVGLDEGLFPNGRSVQEGQVEEERRLAYVAMTRARRGLFLSTARLRRIHGLERLQEPSRFLREIDSRLVEYREEPGFAARSAERSTRGRGGFRSSSARTAASAPRRPARGRRPPRITAPVPANARGTGIALEAAELTSGKPVFHPKFGPGRITETKGSGERLKLTVDFPRAGIKELLARFAKLEGLSAPPS